MQEHVCLLIVEATGENERLRLLGAASFPNSVCVFVAKRSATRLRATSKVQWRPFVIDTTLAWVSAIQTCPIRVSDNEIKNRRHRNTESSSGRDGD